jgi:hypothetical protein
MENELTTIMVNMPNCVNLLFTIKNNVVVKSNRVKLVDSKNAISFYSLSIEIQRGIDTFLNPKAL